MRSAVNRTVPERLWFLSQENENTDTKNNSPRARILLSYSSVLISEVTGPINNPGFTEHRINLNNPPG